MKASVIIPTRDRNESITRALIPLVASVGHRPDVEIVVVDNNEEEATSTNLRQICAAYGGSVRYTSERSPGVCAARHHGLKASSGEILIFIDDDVLVSKQWLNAILGAFEDPSISIVGGPSIPTFESTIPAWLWDFLQPTPYGGWHCGWLSIIDPGKDVIDIDPVWIWSLNTAIRRDTFDELGGFHPCYVPPELQRWQGDGETGLTNKATEAGVRSAFIKDALVNHVIEPGRITPEYFCKRAYYQGICDSFTRIRSGDAPDPAAVEPKSIPDQATRSRWGTTAHEVRVQVANAYNDGWRFHQSETAEDPMLLNWVRRDDFLDADIRKEKELSKIS